MTRQEEKELIAQLQAAKAVYYRKFAPTAGEAETSRARLQAYVMAQGGQLINTRTFVERIKENLNVLRFIVPPKLAYGLAIVVLFISTGTLAAVSRAALPGETFYGTKIALERTQVRFTSNPAARAKVQMELAGNRLKEARAITEKTAVPNGRVEEALNQFTKDVQEATRALKAAGDPVQVKATASVLSEKAEQYRQELQRISGKREKREVELAGAKEAEQALEAVQQEVAKEAEDLAAPGEPPVLGKAEGDGTVEALQEGEVGL